MDIIIFAIITLVASYFQGIAGFGQGLIVAPIAFVLFDKGTALSTLIVIGIILNLYLIRTIKSHLNYRVLGFLLAGGAAGLPIGLIIVHSVPLSVLQLIVGIISIVSVLVLLLYKIKIRRRPLYSFIAGSISGVLQTSTALSGPPVILLLAEENIPKQTIRKLLSTYFFIMGLIAAVLFIVTGLLDGKGIIVGSILAPLVIYGGHIGSMEAQKIHQKTYKLLIIAAVFATGLLAVFEGLGYHFSF